MRSFSIITAAALLAISGAASALDFNANIELDNTYMDQGVGLTQGGRVEFNGSGKAGKNLFVAGKAAFLAKKDGTVSTDDMWFQLGSQEFDVKLGRFEATDLFALPGDTLVEHAAPVLTANSLLRGRKDGKDFHAAATAKLGNGLALEVGLVETKTGPFKGLRPVLTYANGPLNFGIGFEAAKIVATGDKVNDVGLTAGYSFGGGMKLTGNVSVGTGDYKYNTLGLVGTFGAANIGLVSGKIGSGTGSPDRVNTVYASYAMPLFDIKGATVTPAVSFSKAGSAKSNGARVRFNYAF